MKLKAPPKTPSEHASVFFAGLFCLVVLAIVVLMGTALVQATGVYSLLWFFAGLLILAAAYAVGYILYRVT